tara:strand:- start:9 stop:341 length:333 start_codon:yes stop_codon:yes gene_type:complete
MISGSLVSASRIYSSCFSATATKGPTVPMSNFALRQGDYQPQRLRFSRGLIVISRNLKTAFLEDVVVAVHSCQIRTLGFYTTIGPEDHQRAEYKASRAFAPVPLLKYRER